MNDGRRLGIGIIGSGFNARFHLQAFTAVRDADILGSEGAGFLQAMMTLEHGRLGIVSATNRLNAWPSPPSQWPPSQPRCSDSRLPLWPGGPEAGLGLWNSVPATFAVEGALLVAAALAAPGEVSGRRKHHGLRLRRRSSSSSITSRVCR